MPRLPYDRDDEQWRARFPRSFFEALRSVRNVGTGESELAGIVGAHFPQVLNEDKKLPERVRKLIQTFVEKRKEMALSGPKPASKSPIINDK